MWLFTKYGFYSAVCARQGDGKQGMPVDLDRMMVRARSQRHLEALIERCPDQLGNCEVEESSHTDYRFRLFVSKNAWRRVADQLIAEMEYDNFKGAVAKHRGHDAYERSLHDVWKVMYGFQRDRE